jgi:T5SS/PEP-CTERM-associated repeat protein
MSLGTLLVGKRNRILRQAVEPRRAGIEALEGRRLLSVAPTANDDAYEIPPSGHLTVDPTLTAIVPVGPAPMEVVPAKPTETDRIINVIGTERSEPGPVEVGTRHRYGEINVKDGGKYSITGDVMHGQGWTELGAHGGYGKLTVSGGGKMFSSNWTEAGYYGGFADVLVTGAGSEWNTGQFVEIASHAGSGAVFTVADGARFSNGNWFSAGSNGGWARVALSGAGTTWDNFQFFTIASNGGRARMTVSDGATLRTNNWTEIGEHSGSNGRVVVTGAGTSWTNLNWMEIGGDGGNGTLAVVDGASLTTGRLVIAPGGKLAGDGSITLLNQMQWPGHATTPTPDYMENHGLINPGASTGVLKIDGTRLEQFHTGTMRFDFRGTERGTAYDGIDMTGDVVLNGGEVLLRFTHGYAPKAGDAFDLVRARAITGDFDKVTVAGLSGEFKYRIERVSDGGQQVLRLVAESDGTSIHAVIDAPVPPLGRGVLSNDTGPDLDSLLGDRLSPILITKPRHGQLFLDAGGGFTYQAGPTYDGEDSFTYLADDGILTSSPATVSITGEVEPPKPPVAQADSYKAKEDTTLEIGKEQGVLANDTGATVAQLVGRAQNGEVRLNADGSFSYRARLNFNGVDTFTYRAGNAAGIFSEPVTVTIAVEGVNDAPTARPDSKSTRQNTPITFDATDLLANDSDPEHDALSVTGVEATENTHGTVTLSDDGTITFTPDAGFVGLASFAYAVSDGHGNTARGIVNVSVQRNAQQVTGRASGYGSLNDGKQYFLFNVQGQRSGDELSARGRLAFFDVVAGVSFVSTSIDSFTIPQNIHGSTAIFGGSGTLNGRAGYRFEVTVQDFGEGSAMRDTLSIRIVSLSLAPDSFQYEAQGTLDVDFGEIVVRQMPPPPAAGLPVIRRTDRPSVRRR